MKKLLSIGILSNRLKLTNLNTSKPKNHVLRYWEKEFKQIKPRKINGRRYYTDDQVRLIELIKYLLKDKGLTIKGVKNVLNTKINKLDDYNSYSLKADYYKTKLKKKSTEVLKKIRNLKRYGKKISYKGKNGS